MNDPTQKGEIMLQLTGFVLPDVGILTITAFAGKSNPAQVTRKDLDWIANYLREFYSQGVGKVWQQV